MKKPDRIIDRSQRYVPKRLAQAVDGLQEVEVPRVAEGEFLLAARSRF